MRNVSGICFHNVANNNKYLSVANHVDCCKYGFHTFCKNCFSISSSNCSVYLLLPKLYKWDFISGVHLSGWSIK